MLVYAREITPRLNYIFEFIIKEILTLDLKITADSEQFSSSTQPKINYSDRFFDNSFRIKPANLLFEKEIIEQDLYFPVWKDTKVMYITDPHSDMQLLSLCYPGMKNISMRNRTFMAGMMCTVRWPTGMIF